MSLQVSDLQLSADKLTQFAAALGDTGGSNALLQAICDAAAADVARLTTGYVIDPNSITNFAKSIALFRAYGQVGPVPPDVEKTYDDNWKELQSISRGERPNLPKTQDTTQATIAGGWGSEHRLHGRTGRCNW